MTPGPSLDELITSVRTDAASDDALDQLAAAWATVSELEAVADAVLGHFVDQCRRNGRSWTEISGALGVTKQAAHKRFSFTTPTLERFTERARAALRAARHEARTLGHNYVGTEHMLLGLFEPSGGIAAQVLGEVGLSRAGVAEQIGALLNVPPSPPIAGDPPFTPRARAVLGRAVDEAVGLGHNYVGTEHLLLALYGDPEGLAAKILVSSGADRDDVKSRIVEKLSGYTKPAG